MNKLLKELTYNVLMGGGMIYMIAQTVIWMS